MRKKLSQNGFGIVEILLIVVILGVLGFTGWYVWHSKNNTSTKTTTKTSQTTTTKTAATVNTFAECKTATGSIMQETYPEQCITKDGATFTDTSQASQTVAKAPADSQTPAASSCNPVTGQVVTVTLNPDVPSPRCVQVSATQTLALKNASTQTITATLGAESVTIQPGTTGSINVPFGNYLATGVHIVKSELYAGSGAEIWLQ